MKFNQSASHKGLNLTGEANLAGPISLITGPNGCGKTRFLEAIKGGKIIASREDGAPLPPEEIVYLSFTAFQPQPLPSRGANRTAEDSLSTFRRRRQAFDQPLKKAKEDRHDGDGLPFIRLHPIVSRIAERVGKIPSELTDEEFMLYFEAPSPSVDLFASLGLAERFGDYAKSRVTNRRYAYLKAQGLSVNALSEADFLEEFGRPPWLDLQEVIDQTFSGRYRIEVETSEFEDIGVRIRLMNSEGIEIAISQLSSGEQVLFAIALALFKAGHPSTNEIYKGKVLLLDEPDAYLHPKMVMQMYKTFESLVAKCGVEIIFSTHSPTTAALSSPGSIYLLEAGVVRSISKDAAVDALLDGVTQIAIDPENRRQVFVESHFDAATYSTLYRALKSVSGQLDGGVTLEFVPSGPKMPKDQVERALRVAFGDEVAQRAEVFLERLNGDGNCDQASATAQTLAKLGNRSVRALIDWDSKNKPDHAVVVLGLDVYYTKENIFLDSLATAILIALRCNSQGDLAPGKICGQSIGVTDWLQHPSLCQVVVDWFVGKILGVDNARDLTVEYAGGMSVQSDKRLASKNGDDLEKAVLKVAPPLFALVKGGANRRELTHIVAEEIMVTFSGGRLIPQVFANAIRDLQKPLDGR